MRFRLIATLLAVGTSRVALAAVPALAPSMLALHNMHIPSGYIAALDVIDGTQNPRLTIDYIALRLPLIATPGPELRRVACFE